MESKLNCIESINLKAGFTKEILIYVIFIKQILKEYFGLNEEDATMLIINGIYYGDTNIFKMIGIVVNKDKIKKFYGISEEEYNQLDNKGKILRRVYYIYNLMYERYNK